MTPAFADSLAYAETDLPCTMTVRADGAAHSSTVVVDGELDLAFADALRATLAAEQRGGRRRVRIDMSAVTFVDATALGVLANAHHQFRARGGAVVLTGAGPQIRRLLRITGLDDVLPVAEAPAVGIDPSVRNRLRSCMRSQVTAYRRNRRNLLAN